MAKVDAKKLRKKVNELRKLVDNNEADFGEIISVSGTEQHDELLEVVKTLKEIANEILEKEEEYISKGILTAIPKSLTFSDLKELFGEKNVTDHLTKEDQLTE